MDATKKETVRCSRCSGKGRVQWTGLDNGKCYGCYGAGVVSFDPMKSTKLWTRDKAIVAIKRHLDKLASFSDAEMSEYGNEEMHALAQAIGRSPADVMQRGLEVARKLHALSSVDVLWVERAVADERSRVAS